MFLQADNDFIPFDLHRILMNDLPYHFLWEVLGRSVFMFIIIIIGLKITGRRELKQLSAFELIIILALGSAAGDTMFYEDVAIIPTLVVFIVVIGLYKIITHFIATQKKVEHFFEGKPITIIENGIFIFEAVAKQNLALDEFLMELRNESIEHLGQVRTAIFEVNGSISLLYFSEENTIPGLPIFPDKLKNKLRVIEKAGKYACLYCGMVHVMEASASEQVCPNCGHKEWVEAIEAKRVS